MTDANRHHAPWSSRVRAAKRRGAYRAADDIRTIEAAGRERLATLKQRLAEDERMARARQEERRRRRTHATRVVTFLGAFAVAWAGFVAAAPLPGSPLAAGPVTTVGPDVAQAMRVHETDHQLAAAPPPDETDHQLAAVPNAAEAPPATSLPTQSSPPPPRWTPPAPSPPAATATCDDTIGDPCCAFGEMVC